MKTYAEFDQTNPLHLAKAYSKLDGAGRLVFDVASAAADNRKISLDGPLAELAELYIEENGWESFDY